MMTTPTQPELSFTGPRRYRRHAAHRMHEHSRNAREDFTPREHAIVDFIRKATRTTARRIAEGLGFADMNAVRPRITELVDRGILRECGETNDHRTGKTVMLLELAPQ